MGGCYDHQNPRFPEQRLSDLLGNIFGICTAGNGAFIGASGSDLSDFLLASSIVYGFEGTAKARLMERHPPLRLHDRLRFVAVAPSFSATRFRCGEARGNCVN